MRLSKPKNVYAIAVTGGAVAAATAIFFSLPRAEHYGGGDAVCDSMLQAVGVITWVISFAYSTLWLLTHCECRRPDSAHLLAHAFCAPCSAQLFF